MALAHAWVTAAAAPPPPHHRLIRLLLPRPGRALASTSRGRDRHAAHPPSVSYSGRRRQSGSPNFLQAPASVKLPAASLPSLHSHPQSLSVSPGGRGCLLLLSIVTPLQATPAAAPQPSTWLASRVLATVDRTCSSLLRYRSPNPVHRRAAVSDELDAVWLTRSARINLALSVYPVSSSQQQQQQQQPKINKSKQKNLTNLTNKRYR